MDRIISPKNMDEPQCDADTIRMLRAQLRVVTDDLESLLEDGFPRKGRSGDDKDAHLQWWEQRWAHVAWARKALDLSEGASA